MATSTPAEDPEPDDPDEEPDPGDDGWYFPTDPPDQIDDLYASDRAEDAYYHTHLGWDQETP